MRPATQRSSCMKCLRYALQTLVLMCAVGHLSAIADSPGIKWQELTQEQREMLSRFEERWEQLPLARQRKLAEGAERWAKMTPEQRQEARAMMKRWHSLDGDKRREMLERQREFKLLPPEEQARIRQEFDRFQRLSPDERRELRERFKKLTPEERAALRERIRRGELPPRGHRHPPPAGELPESPPPR